MIIIRKTHAVNLFKYVLCVNYAESWEIKEVNESLDESVVNPDVYFKTQKWSKLLNLIETFIAKNKPIEFTDESSDMDLVVGSFIEIKNRINFYLKEGK